MNNYSEEDYNSNNGMQVNVWGPLLWNYLHLISFNYPIKPTLVQKKKYYQMILLFGDTLPCKKCREHFVENIKLLGFSANDMKSRETFSRFIYKLHKQVNKITGKKNDITYNEVRDKFEHFRSRNDEAINNKVNEPKNKKIEKYKTIIKYLKI